MNQIRTLFFDVGGVVLSNAWDSQERRTVAERLGLDHAELDKRHKKFMHPLERGEISLNEYLAKTVFYRQRPFTQQEFIQYMRSQSKPFGSSLKLLQKLKAGNRYVMAVINNESAELNNFRVERFHLERYFSLFFSSCYLGVRKPDPRIYQIAMDVTRTRPREAVLIDDRIENVSAARKLRMQVIHVQSVKELPAQLTALGVGWQ